MLRWKPTRVLMSIMASNLSLNPIASPAALARRPLGIDRDRERSYERITKTDLRRLGALALADLHSLFARYPETGRLYRNRLFAVALCQGAALHYIDGKNGIKDFDVWCFFRSTRLRPFPYRRNSTADFGRPKFGKSPGWEHFAGRRVDILGRSLDVAPGADPGPVLQSYLREGRTTTAHHLAAKAVVLILPTERVGEIVWPVE
jgi:hypothetical protein